MSKEKLSYADALLELEAIVHLIEQDDVDIDLLLEKVKRASVLVKACKEKLKTADNELQKLLGEMNDDKNL